MLAHTNEDFPDLRDVTAKGITDKAEFNQLPKLIRATIITCALLSGKTIVEARTTFRQVWSSLP